MYEATVNEFPFVAELPKREKSKMAKLWDQFQEMKRLTEQKGMLIPPGMANELLGVSRQRVYELISQGTLEVVQVCGRGYVTENSLVAWCEAEHKVGRPTKVEQAARKGNLALAKESVEMARRYVREEKAHRRK